MSIAIAKIKDVPCADCGLKYPPYVMDFDHVRGVKSFNISAKGRVCSMEKLMEEVSKCEIVCSNCHRIRTAKRTPLRCGVIRNAADSESVVAGA